MVTEHLAQITWSQEQVRRGLPSFAKTTDPAQFDGAPEGSDAWSLVCSFDTAPANQGNPSLARVRFMMENAPHELLRPGATLQLFERATQGYATVKILD